ncbi:MAG: DEAD/DEAH box helicase family protein [Firmicutes bacterium]|nr:helicase-related protein [Bacillota bacterium]NLO66575.1 DEAD/DEAH box helicase family protein [Bacillota bacterium]
MFKLHVYAVQADDGLRLGLIRDPKHLPDLLDEAGLENTSLLSSPLPSARAWDEVIRWSRRLDGKFGRFWRRVITWHPTPRVMETAGSENVEEVLTAVKELTAGRIVLERRLVEGLRRLGYWPADVMRAIDIGIKRWELRHSPGLFYSGWDESECTRCGSVRPAVHEPCAACGSEECLICPECATMGAVRGCDNFIELASHYPTSEPMPVKLQLDIELTAAQEGASAELLEFWHSSDRWALVWAACGAGKTEVTFALIRQALSEGAQVLFAIPRRDIVREIAQRLRAAFPDVTVAVHYGGQPWHAPGDLVVATTHQVLGFSNRFQLAILDEVDAFPYQGSEMLRYGLRRSLTLDGKLGKLVEMTATPNNVHRYQRVITIPARYHGYPLPEPTLVEWRLPELDGLTVESLPPHVLEYLRTVDSPWLVFGPTIKACERIQGVLSSALEKRVGICHSQLEERSQVIEDFRQGRLDVLVTTTVLERGVTFPDVQVVVLYADHALYNVSTLVQVAGRVGRRQESPTGRVVFVGSTVTTEMKEALRLIRTLNKEARDKGLLKNERGA